MLPAVHAPASLPPPIFFKSEKFPFIALRCSGPIGIGQTGSSVATPLRYSLLRRFSLLENRAALSLPSGHCNCAREGGDVNNLRGPLYFCLSLRKCERIGEDKPALCVCVEHFDCFPG